jgi:hypothetical protein
MSDVPLAIELAYEFLQKHRGKVMFRYGRRFHGAYPIFDIVLDHNGASQAKIIYRQDGSGTELPYSMDDRLTYRKVKDSVGTVYMLEVHETPVQTPVETVEEAVKEKHESFPRPIELDMVDALLKKGTSVVLVNHEEAEGRQHYGIHSIDFDDARHGAHLQIVDPWDGTLNSFNIGYNMEGRLDLVKNDRWELHIGNGHHAD